MSGYIPADAEFVRNNTRVIFDVELGNIVEVIESEDRSKLDKVIDTLLPLKLAEREQQDLIFRAQNACYDYFMSSATKPKDQSNLLREFVHASKAAAQAWSALGHALQQALLVHVEQRGPISRGGASAERILQNVERSTRFKQVVTDDVYAMAQGAVDIAEILNENTARQTPEYLFCVRIIGAWLECVGERPAVSRNNNGRGGEHLLSPFERFLAAILAPRTIGERVI